MAGGGMTGGGGGTAGRQDPLIQAHFWVEMGDWITGMVFRECSGIGSESDVVEYKGANKGDYHTIQAVPGRLKWQKVSLKRGITADTDDFNLWKWRQKVEDGKVDDARCSGTISMVNQAGETVASWTFDRCWPTKVSGPQFNSGGNEVGVEELEIVHEGMRRVSV